MIEHNLIWNTKDSGIQIVAEARIRNNIVAYTVADRIRSKPHQSAKPHDPLIEKNEVLLAQASDIRIPGPHLGNIGIKYNRIRNGAVRVEPKSGVEVQSNGASSMGATKFAPRKPPAWEPASTFRIKEYLLKY